MAATHQHSFGPTDFTDSFGPESGFGFGLLPPPGLDAGPPSPSCWNVDGPTRWTDALHDEAVRASGDRFDGKAAEIWRIAEARLQALERQQSESTARLEQELKRCAEKHEAMEEQRLQLERNVAALQERLAVAEAALRLSATPIGSPILDWNQTPSPVQSVQPFLWLSGPGPPGLAGPMVDPAVRRPLPAFPLAGAPELAEAPKSPWSPPAPSALVLAELIGMQSPQPKSKCDEDLPPGLATPKTPMVPRPAASPQRGNACPRAATPSRPSPRTPQPMGLMTPQRTPRTTMGTMTPIKSPMVPSSPFVICEGGGCVFGFMLRLADGVDLGLDVVHGDTDKALLVMGIRLGGAIEAWNKQCVGGPAAGKAVMPGDRIVGINQAADPVSMLEECRTKQMLRLTVARGEQGDSVAPIWLDDFKRVIREKARPPVPPMPMTPEASRPLLRADANEFVPVTASAGPAAA